MDKVELMGLDLSHDEVVKLQAQLVCLESDDETGKIRVIIPAGW